MFGYREFAPPPTLRGSVAAFWQFSAPPASTAFPQPHRVLPDGCVDVILRVEPRSTTRAEGSTLTVHGPSDRFTLVPIAPHTWFAGVRFRPGAAGAILGVEPASLFRHAIPVAALSGWVTTLASRFHAGMPAPLVRDALRDALLAQQGRREPLAPHVARALNLIHASGGRMRIARIAAAAAVSERTLRRDLTAAVGLPPKTLARILRFQHTLALLRTGDSPDLTTVALDGGYADHAHMGREFRALSGLTPTAFVGRPPHV